MELISNRRRYGQFDGEVFICQASDTTHSNSVDTTSSKLEYSAVTTSESMAFVPRDAVSLYLPGLTYYETLSYAARLRMRNPGGLSSSQMASAREDRVADILEVMNLTRCKDRVIAYRPTARGSIGGELRKIAIAVEIVSLPSVIVMEDITEGLDVVVSAEIVSTLATLASRGHTVVSSFAKIHPEEIDKFDKITLISKGYSIYSSSPQNVSPYFSNINFECLHDTDVAEFLLDVGNGTERPLGERRAVDASSLQAQFEESDFYQQYRAASSGSGYSSPVLHVYHGGFSISSDFVFGLKNAFIVMERAWCLKFKEVEVLKKSFGASVFLSLFFGYFGWQLGSATEYTVGLIPFPYSEVSTTTSLMYICTAVQLGMQVLNVHIFYQKQKVFQYEREGGVVSLPSFIASSLITEIPLAAFFSFIFSTIVFFMVDLGSGLDNYLWWIGVLQLTACIGVMIVLVFTSILKHEIAIRDVFLFCLISMIWTGGFMYPQSVLNDWVLKIANINPLRWIFESVMVWKWEDYPDGEFYLGTYNYENYDKNDIWMITAYFLIVSVVLYVLGLVQFPNTLRRTSSTISSSPSRESQAEADIAYLKKIESLKKPSIISRDSSFSAHSKNLSSQASTMQGEGISRGPRVTFSNLAYQVPDTASPLGKKAIIHPMSGMFDWGKLGIIMGAEGSGKSSLLHILGNQTLGSNAELKGTIYHDDKNVEDVPLLPWQRCAFIESMDEHFRDLTVMDIMTYAMLLRTDELLPEAELESNINNAIELLQLEEVKFSKAKKLTDGELRRLTIAEDIVHGPHLILMDEPITNLDARESSIIMTHAVRELVNQDRTVILTLYQPSAAVFDLCDTLALLSKGRLIYMGNVADAVNFFVQSPTMPLKLDKAYENPADFLDSVSANLICDQKNEAADATRLENSYKNSSLCMLFMETQLKQKKIYAAAEKASGLDNPLNRLSVGGNDEEAQDSHATMNNADEEWRYASSVDTRSRSRSLSIVRPASTSTPPSTKGNLATSIQLSLRRLMIPLLTSIHEIKNINISAQFRKARVINRRAFWALFKREKLVIGTTLMYVYIGVFTCLILQTDLESNPGVLTAISMFGAFLLLVSQLQYVFFLFNNQKVSYYLSATVKVGCFDKCNQYIYSC
jgi:ABC-type multidrug transport system ATPase subunit